MGSDKRKYEAMIPKTEAGLFLQKIGEGLECGCLTIGEEQVELSGFKSFKVSLKDRGESYLLKIKIKEPKESDEKSDKKAEAAEEE